MFGRWLVGRQASNRFIITLFNCRYFVIPIYNTNTYTQINYKLLINVLWLLITIKEESIWL